MIELRLAKIEDIIDITELRLTYLKEIRNNISPYDEQLIIWNNIEYLKEHLNKDCFVSAVWINGKAVSSSYLGVYRKAANFRTITGIYGEIYGVYTLPKYRRKGYAISTIKKLITSAQDNNINSIVLESSKDGIDMYLKLGFIPDQSNYQTMWLIK